MSRLLATSAALLLLVPGARAQEDGGNVHLESWEAMSLGSSILGVQRTRLLPRFVLSAELAASYAHRPLDVQVYRADSELEPETLEVFPGRIRTELLFGYGLFDQIQLTAGVPAYLTTGTPAGAWGGREPEELSGFAMGDVRVIVDADLVGLLPSSVRANLFGFGLAVGLSTWIPTGDTVKFAGEGAFRFEPRVALDYENRRGLRAGLVVGYHLRPASRVGGYVNDDLVRWGLQLAVPLGRSDVDVTGSLYGSRQTVLQPDPRNPDERIAIPEYDPVDVLAGARYLGPADLRAEAAAGTGLSGGVGTPAFRVLGQLAWQTDVRDWLPEVHDVDGDGLEDGDDLCPWEPENENGVRDDDGCPEDLELAALAEAEAIRAAEAARAAKAGELPIETAPAPPPEPALELTSVAAEPADAEALDALTPWDPDLLPALERPQDADGDGIPDPEDRCREEPEDADGFQDGDGCPDPDHDGDGLADGEDRCPVEAETANGFEDGDGCPDVGPDADGDRVGDAVDLCPLDPEGPDGVRDHDGCPEAPAAWAVKVPWEAAPSPEPREREATKAEVPKPPGKMRDVEPLESFDPSEALPPLPVATDADGDGLLSHEDLCPEVPEDRDGFEDEDGCPDLDDDLDGVPDSRDLCAGAPETHNGILDEDGCPDAPGDMDGDGVRDEVDECPREQEDVDGLRDDDGCPELDIELPAAEAGPPAPLVPASPEAPAPPPPAVEIAPPPEDASRIEVADPASIPLDLPKRADTDRDGLFDDGDLCPAAPEDQDGIADEDGCPEVDFDDDRIPDAKDLCPIEAEIQNAFEDADGCPDRGPDSDGDGLEDFFDLCPLEDETDDAVRDADGCPELDPAERARLSGSEAPVEPPKPVSDLVPRPATLGDVDGDRIPDGVDACSSEAEDHDGYQDDDGCPDPDNDRDGVPDDRDACPLESENSNGILDSDGCPDRGHDADRDLVDDEDDLCPLEPEDQDGVRDADGCPDEGWTSRPATLAEEPTPVAEGPPAGGVAEGVDARPLLRPALDALEPAPVVLLPPLLPDFDADLDGVGPEDDHCPFSAEDADGFQEGDGCPDGDNDGDRIPDASDRCPDEAESPNGYADEDGCPDETPQAIARVLARSSRIQFLSGSATLTEESAPVLQAVLATLRADPALRMTIDGHTDDVGTPELNHTLSLERARAVVAWLVQRGIQPRRLAARGFGTDRPLAPNDTPEGRAQNRRVELNYEREREEP